MKTKFQGKAELYEQYRPHYPKDCIQDLTRHIPEHGVIADIGSGTGIFTEQLLQQGNSEIIAAEPEEDMLQIAIAKLSHYQERFCPMQCAAEQLTIPDLSIDLITVAQAFHWFDKIKFKAECQRILKPGGHVALIWNIYDTTKKNCRDIEERSVAYGNATLKLDFENTISDFYQQGKYEKRIYPNDISMNFEQFKGYLLSKSNALKETDKNYDAYMADIQALFKFHQKNNKINIYQNTVCYIGSI